MNQQHGATLVWIALVVLLHPVPCASLSPASASAKTLILYTYSDTDPEYAANLQYFVETGMRGDDGNDYYIIIQEDEGSDSSDVVLPDLPDNAHYVYHANECFDWGTVGWALSTLKLNLDIYSFFIFMNSSVRGPFLPAYWPRKVHWSRILTSKLVGKVKLVGSTISCEPFFESADKSKDLRQNPHVQSYVVATDKVGLGVLLRDLKVFRCHDNIADAVYHAELGSSAAILAAGYTIDSLMLRYRDVDWSDERNWACNAMMNPYADMAYDGVVLNPLEVLFVKIKGFQLDSNWVSTRLATTYARWAQDQGEAGDVNSNVYRASPTQFNLGRVLEMQVRGRRCFDYDYFREMSPDLPASWPEDHLWNMFVSTYQFEGRAYRFMCENPLLDEGRAKRFLEWYASEVEMYMDMDE